jgi:hypothetical protein
VSSSTGRISSPAWTLSTSWASRHRPLATRRCHRGRDPQPDRRSLPASHRQPRLPTAHNIAELQTQLDEFTTYYNTIRAHRAVHRRTASRALPAPPGIRGPARLIHTANNTRRLGDIGFNPRQSQAHCQMQLPKLSQRRIGHRLTHAAAHIHRRPGQLSLNNRRLMSGHARMIQPGPGRTR